MRAFRASTQQAPAGWPFLLGSIALHALLVLLLTLTFAPPDAFELQIPQDIELGLIDGDPGEEGSPEPAAAPAPEPEPVPEPAVVREPVVVEEPLIAVDAGVLEIPDAGEALEGEPPDGGSIGEPAGGAEGNDGLVAAKQSGRGEGGSGEGLGFGAGGFGSGHGGPLGAIIGLHADLNAVRDTSLILETRALLDVIPQWQRMLAGSGVHPLEDFSRLFVATPNLKRAYLVLSAEHRGGSDFVERAAQKLAEERGKPLERTGKTMPWHSRGPTPRVVRKLGGKQFVVARAPDVKRAVAVGASLARRHARQPGMERRRGARALLAMYEGEALALSVEGVGTYVPASVDYAPKGMRLSLRHLDEYHAVLVAYGYYDSAARAAAAHGRVEALRVAWAHHKQASYLGLESALEEAEITRRRDTLKLEAKLTLHQTRYVLGYVTRALNPRK